MPIYPANFNQELQRQFSSLGQYLAEQQKRKQDLQDALYLAREKAKIEQTQDPTKIMELALTARALGIPLESLMSSQGQGMTSPGAMPQTPTMPAIQGQGMSSAGGFGQFRPETVNLGGIGFKRMPTEEEIQQDIDIKARQTRANEAAKPYTELEAGVMAKGQLLTPVIDKLIELVEKNNVYEGLGVPFGASRIGSFGEKGPWQAFKRGLTAGKGREAGLLLKDIKILAFGEGGKTLSENERMTALSNIDPSYKTEKQWIDGLKQAKALLLKKAELMKKSFPMETKQSQNDDPLGIR